MKQSRIDYLERLIKKHSIKEDDFMPKFKRYAKYLGLGVYEIQGLKSNDTRELFLMYCLTKINIKYKQVKDK